MAFELLKELAEQASHMELARGLATVHNEARRRNLMSPSYLQWIDAIDKNVLRNAKELTITETEARHA